MTLADRLSAIEARCAKATPGPWEWMMPDGSVMWLGTKDKQDMPGGHVLWSSICRACQGYKDSRCTAPSDDNADFIAHARTDVPLLLAALRRAVEGLSEINSGLDNHWCKRTADTTLADLARLLGEGEK